MSDSPKKRRRLLPIVLGLVGACLVLAIIGAVLNPSEEPAAPAPTSQPAAAVAQPTAPPQPVSTPTLEQHILAAIGDSNRANAPAPVLEIGENIVVTFPASDNLTVNMMRSDVQRTVLAIAQTVRDNTGNAHDLRVESTGQLTDAFGNTSEGPIMRVNLSRATLEKINFEGIQPDNLPLIADIYWQHPALNE